MYRHTSSMLGGTERVIGIGYEPGTATKLLYEEQNKQLIAWHVNTMMLSKRLATTQYFSVLFAEVADESALEAARGPCPKRHLALTTRALIHGPEPTLEHFQGLSVWGIAAIKKHREILLDYLGESEAS